MIKMYNFKKQYNSIKEEIDFSIQSVLDDSAFSSGKYVESFENKFSNYIGSKYCVAVNNGTSALHVALLALGIKPKFYQASTSELYGKVQEIPQTEKTPFYPRSPYAAAKLYAYWIVKNYREAYNLFASNGILFNHESERRGKTFVTRKITVAISKIVLGLENKISLGNLDAKRDWGYAPEFVEGMWRILQAKKPDDYVLATGKTHTVREFVEKSFSTLNEEILWQGEGINEIGVLKSSGKKVVDINPRYFRPTEVDLLIGDYSKVKKDLDWEPKIKFDSLVKIMVESDYSKIKERNGL